jgi:hypothetical protein
VILFYKVATFFKEVEALAKDYRENNALKRVKKTAKRIKIIIAKLNNGI